VLQEQGPKYFARVTTVLAEGKRKQTKDISDNRTGMDIWLGNIGVGK
jgi:hypothetical protein